MRGSTAYLGILLISLRKDCLKSLETELESNESFYSTSEYLLSFTALVSFFFLFLAVISIKTKPKRELQALPCRAIRCSPIARRMC